MIELINPFLEQIRKLPPAAIPAVVERLAHSSEVTPHPKQQLFVKSYASSRQGTGRADRERERESDRERERAKSGLCRGM